MKPLLMRMEPFYGRSPGVKVMNIQGFCVEKSDVIPAGDYALQEWYCADAGCDCRRVLLNVHPRQRPNEVLAAICFGWETLEFYTRFFDGDAATARAVKEGCLDRSVHQSPIAALLLKLTRHEFLCDPNYAALLAQHYQEFRGRQRGDKSGLQ
jgi:hypothetical protein